MKDFICVNNVSDDFWRLLPGQKYELFINSYSWIVKKDNFWLFFYTPNHFIGKIKDSQIPQAVISRINEFEIHIKDNVWLKGENDCNIMSPGNHVLKPSSIRLSKLEHTLGAGNWFYAMGQNYVTFNGVFICDDVYMPNLERECPIGQINGRIVSDMCRNGMVCRTRTPHYFKGIFDFPFFSGVNTQGIQIFNFNEMDWDSEEWKHEFKMLSQHARYNRQSSIDDIRQMRKEVFMHTVNVVNQGFYDTDHGNRVFLPNQDKLVNNTKFYSHEIKLVNDYPPTENTIVKIENIDCLLAAKRLQSNRYNVAVLNMASRQKPGGGVYGGAGAQEENIFRRSNIFLSMFQFAPYAPEYGIPKSKNQYPLDRNYGAIYTKNATVFRDTEDNGYALLEEPFRMSFISVPGMNRPELTDDGMIVQHLVEPIKNKIRTIFRIGLENGHDALVLGALGCGAFKNPPKHIARLFHEVIEESEFANRYKLLLFAILEDHNSHHSHNPEGNFKPFEEEF